MENTIENAQEFYLANLSGIDGEPSIFEFATIMSKYASTCSVPSSIGEDEIEAVRQILAKTCSKNETLSGIETTWNWSDQAKAVCDYFRSRLSERKIVKDEPFAEALILLRELSDLQNGPPLIRYEKEWLDTTQKIYNFLEKYELK